MREHLLILTAYRRIINFASCAPCCSKYLNKLHRSTPLGAKNVLICLQQPFWSAILFQLFFLRKKGLRLHSVVSVYVPCNQITQTNKHFSRNQNFPMPKTQTFGLNKQINKCAWICVCSPQIKKGTAAFCFKSCYLVSDWCKRACECVSKGCRARIRAKIHNLQLE